ncbi:MAG: TerB family tellurite resistance protein, partial [Desulfobacterales bacterium]|nr:TerB family tellurite resistance protein [Desulfobacterales bacterium]
YENPVMAWLYGVKESAAKKEEKSQKAKSEHQARTRDRDHWHDEVAKGGYPEAAIRMIIAMAGADGSVDEAELKVGTSIIKASWRLKRLAPEEIQRIIKEQSRILQTDMEEALAALPQLISRQKDRKRALKLATEIAWADSVLDEREEALLKKMKEVLQIR